MLLEGADRIERAAALLAAGELLGFPTETVYGLGADAGDPAAVAKIYAAKGRPANHPVIVHVPPNGDVMYWVRDLPAAARALIDAFWPGPLTLILPRSARVCDALTGGQDSVGVRCPSHPLAIGLLTAFSDAHRNGHGGVAGPSANRFGRVSPSTAQHVIDEFGDGLAVLDGGPCEVGIESTIVDVSRGYPALLRPGGINREAIANVLGGLPELPGDARQPAPRASGTLQAHYAPTTPLLLADADRIVALFAMRAGCEPVAVVGSPRLLERLAALPPERLIGMRQLNAPAEPAAYAHGLYALLRSLDDGSVRRIIIEQLPDTPAWAAVRDRLGRAAAAFV